MTSTSCRGLFVFLVLCDLHVKSCGYCSVFLLEMSNFHIHEGNLYVQGYQFCNEWLGTTCEAIEPNFTHYYVFH